MSRRIVGICLGICLIATTSATAQPNVAHLPPIEQGSLAVRLEPLVTGLNTPTDLTAARDGSGRLFVTDLFGAVSVVQDGALQPTPFLDVRSTTDTGTSASYGMTGISLHPEFHQVGSPGYGKVFTVRTQLPDTAPAHFNPGSHRVQSVVEEWRVDPANPHVIDLSSRRDILRVNQPATIHHLNQAIFGPDGMLYVSLGDGGNLYGDRARQMSNPFGTILRIDVDNADAPGGNGRYAIPADNPFVGQPDTLGEIYASGFRNPYRMSFDRVTGELYVGDVGQISIEEIDRVVAGGDYGWNLKEGSFKYDKLTQNVSPDDDGTASRNNLIDPIAEYDHTEGGSIAGGFVYRGSQLPELEGKYVFGELGWRTGGARLFYLDTASGEFKEFLLDPVGTQLDGFYLYGLGEDEDNELYLVGRGGSAATDTGMVVQVLSESRAWAADAGGIWSSPANWSREGVPGGVNAAAVLGGVISEPRQVDVDVPVTLGTLRFEGNHGYELRGSGMLTMDVSPNRSADLSVAGTAAHVISAPLALVDDTVVTVTEAGAKLALADLAPTSRRITKRGDGTLEVNRLSAGALNVEAGIVRIAAGGSKGDGMNVVGSLSLAGETGAWTSTLDIADNDLIIGGENTAETLARIVDQVKQARDGGDAGRWSGMGITSLAAAADPLTGIAVVMMPDSGNVLLSHTYNGDANLDGRINADDYFRIDSGFLAQPANPTYTQGDFNYDGTINADDYFLIDSAFLGQGAPLEMSAITAATVPEPGGMIGAILIGGMVWSHRCRRRRRRTGR